MNKIDHGEDAFIYEKGYDSREAIKNKKFVENNPILNTDALIIEYEDIIKSPQFVLLQALQQQEDLKDLLDAHEIDDMSVDELYEWYVQRGNPNVILEFAIDSKVIRERIPNEEDVINFSNQLLLQNLLEIPDLVKNGPELNFPATLRTLLGIAKSLVKRIFIWSPYDSEIPAIKDDITRLFGNRVTYIYGNIVDVVKEYEIGRDTTFVFSDLVHVGELADAGMLNMTSVILADDYGYSKDDDGEYILNMDALHDSFVFKFDVFDNIHVVDEEVNEDESEDDDNE